jgi:hypothetical protein
MVQDYVDFTNEILTKYSFFKDGSFLQLYIKRIKVNVFYSILISTLLDATLTLLWRSVRVALLCRYTAATLPLHCRYTAATLPLHCRYTAATLPLHCRYTAATLPLHCRYTAATLPLHCTIVWQADVGFSKNSIFQHPNAQKKKNILISEKNCLKILAPIISPLCALPLHCHYSATTLPLPWRYSDTLWLCLWCYLTYKWYKWQNIWSI